MGRYSEPEYNLSSAERMQRLLQEGAAFRADMLVSRDIVRSNLNSKSLATVLLGRVSGIASSFFSNRSSLQGNLPTMLPLLLTGASWLSKRRPRKPLLVGAALLAAIGGAAYVNSRKNKTTDDE